MDVVWRRRCDLIFATFAGYSAHGVQAIVDFLNTYVWAFPEKLPWLVVVLLAAGFYVTLRLMFVQVRQVGHAIMVVTGRFDDPDDPGDVNHFQALSTALSATVGIGNIAGVATAIHYGGPGAVFWMWVTAVLGMALKFAECTLSVHYRSFDEKGEAAGGPMYYIERGLGKGWKPLAVFFAVCAILSSWGSGNMNQANTVAVSAQSDFGIASWIVGGLVVVVVGAVILGGIKSIAKVTSRLAPSMAVLYVLAALVILALNVTEVPGALATIVSSAFNPAAGVGGSVAGVWSLTLLWGVKRGLFSNEAGQGSAPIAHAAAKTDEPVSEGVVALLEPLIDTLIICTMTGLVILITGVWSEKIPTEFELTGDVAWVVTNELGMTAQGDVPEKVVIVEGRQEGGDARIGWHEAEVDELYVDAERTRPFSGEILVAEGKIVGTDGTEYAMLHTHAYENGAPLTKLAFERGLPGDWGGIIVLLSVLLFGISTAISWSYYGDRCANYIWGPKAILPYKVLFVTMHFVGAVLSLDTVWKLGDIALGLVTFPNLVALVLLSGLVKKLTNSYFERKPWIQNREDHKRWVAEHKKK